MVATPDTAERAAGVRPWSVEIRPGVRFPDWDVVQSDTVRSALNDIFGAFGVDERWRGFSGREDSVRRAILQHYRRAGHAPSVSELAVSLDLPTEVVHELLDALKQRDLIVYEPETGTIAGAYPLTERPTEHQVRMGDITVHAMCAIDALGVGRMYGRDVVIDSSCRATGTPIRVATAEDGRRTASITPQTAVVWSGIRASEGCAADTLCPLIAFFADDATLGRWRAREHPTVVGYRLSMAEAMQAGMALFAPALARADQSQARSMT